MRLIFDLLFQLKPFRNLDIEYRISTKKTLEAITFFIFWCFFLVCWNLFTQWCLICFVLFLPQQMKFGTGMLRDLHESKLVGTFRQTEVFLTSISWFFVACFLCI